MIWKIAKKDLLLNLMTLKFAIGAVACVLLACVFVPILAADYRQRSESYNKHVIDNESELRKVKVYRNIRHTVYRPPAVLSTFSSGLERQLTDLAKIELEKVPEQSVTERKGNPYISLFEVFDVSLIFKIVISILALLVSYDVISGEREQGTLKLMLSGETSRWQMLLGKILGGLVTLSVPVAITFVTAVVVLLSSPMVALSGSDWFRMGLMFVVSLAFTSVMYLLGLLFSCMAKRSAISMVLGLFVWIVFAIVIPNASVHLATQLHPLESQEKRDGRMISLKEDLANELGDIKVDFSKALITSDERDVFGGYHAKRRDIYWLNAEQKLNAQAIPVKLKYADKFWDLEHNDLSSFFGQKSLAHSLSIFSPISAYESAMAILAGTDIGSFTHFFGAIRTHRNGVVEYIRSSTNDFSSPSFFAICTEEESAEYTRLYVRIKQAEDEQAKAEARQALEEWEQKNPAEAASLNLQDFPWFRYRPSPVQDIQRAIPDLTTLLIMNIVLFAVCFAALERYDVR